MKTALLILNAFCAGSLAYQWYLGLTVPAWIALLWCSSVLLQSLEDWWDKK